MTPVLSSLCCRSEVSKRRTAVRALVAMASSALATRVSRAFPGPRRKPRASASEARASRAALASDDERVADDDVVVTKRALLSAVSDSRRPGADPRACKAAILEACRALESRGAVGGDIPFADVSGRWSLVYSTNDPSGVAGTFTSPLAGVLDEDAFQRVSDQLYKAFFAFAPALAGSAETNAKGVANTQVVDLENKKVDNVVDAELPWPLGEVRVGVRGEIEALDAEAREVAVTFTSWEIGAKPASGGTPTFPTLRLPLPRPRGVLRNTFCDETLRVSRGGRGGVFVVSRIAP